MKREMLILAANRKQTWGLRERLPNPPRIRSRGRNGWRYRMVAGFVATAALLTALCASAQEFRIGWFTVDTGGGKMSGGAFTLSGTAGQSDAGKLEGGAFTVIGGFWGIVQVIQTPGAPRLSVSREASSGDVTIAWSLPDDGWLLEESPTLGRSPNPWTQVPPFTYQSNATQRFITIPNPTGNKFYRLRRP